MEHLYDNYTVTTDQEPHPQARLHDFAVWVSLVIITAMIASAIAQGAPVTGLPQSPQVITLTKFVCLPTPVATTPDVYTPYWRP